MKLINKTNQDIIKNKNLNSKFLSANFEKLQINCKILKDDFYLDSYNYFPITKEYYTYRENFLLGRTI